MKVNIIGSVFEPGIGIAVFGGPLFAGASLSVLAMGNSQTDRAYIGLTPEAVRRLVPENELGLWRGDMACAMPKSKATTSSTCKRALSLC